MLLNFLERRDGYLDNNPSAYFVTPKKEMVLIDCPVNTVPNLTGMDLSSFSNFYALITHLHQDHVSGLKKWCEYVYRFAKKRVTVIVPDEETLQALEYILKVEGLEKKEFELITTDNFITPWLFKVIPVDVSSPLVPGKCYGYILKIDGKTVIYTGGTTDITPFYTFITQNTEIFVETDVHYGMKKMDYNKTLHKLLDFANKGVKVYLINHSSSSNLNIDHKNIMPLRTV